MDRTLRKAKRANMRRQDRNLTAWKRLLARRRLCVDIATTTPRRICVDRDNPTCTGRASDGIGYTSRSVRLYRHETPDNGTALVRRMVVSRSAEFITVFGGACAQEMGKQHVACYQRNYRGRRSRRP